LSAKKKEKKKIKDGVHVGHTNPGAGGWRGFFSRSGKKKKGGGKKNGASTVYFVRPNKKKEERYFLALPARGKKD